MLENTLLKLILANKYKWFTRIYEGYSHKKVHLLNDKLICTAILYKDEISNQFIRYLAESYPTVQLVCLMIYRGMPDSISYIEKMSVEEKSFALTKISPILRVAIDKEDLASLDSLKSLMQPEDYMTGILISNSSYQEDILATLGPEHLAMVLNLMENNTERYWSYIDKYYPGHKEFLVDYYKEENKLFVRLFSLCRNPSPMSALHNLRDVHIISHMTGPSSGISWCEKIFEPANMPKDNSAIYRKIKLETNLAEKKYNVTVKL